MGSFGMDANTYVFQNEIDACHCITPDQVSHVLVPIQRKEPLLCTKRSVPVERRKQTLFSID